MVDLSEKRQAFARLPQLFPNLLNTGFTIADVTSSATISYNCIAYAAKDESKPWWPMPQSLSYGYYHWPDGLPREDPATVENFYRAFETLGFKRCTNEKRELGYEKVAIYVNGNNEPTHMARDLGDGKWYSKLGDLQDIRHHNLDGLENSSYGQALYFMRKPLVNYPGWKRVVGRFIPRRYWK